MDVGFAVARRVNHVMPHMMNQNFSYIRIKVRNCSFSVSPKAKRRSTTRETT